MARDLTESTVATGESRRRALEAVRMSIARFSGLYGIVILVVLFSLTLPHVFPTSVTFRLILQDQAIGGLLALGALIPLAAGSIDLAFAYVAGLAMVVLAWLTSNTDISEPLCVAIAMAVAIAFGVLSGLIVTALNLDSIIVTLGIGTVALGVTEKITGGSVITAKLSPGLKKLGQGLVGPVPVPALVLFVVAAVMYVWLEHTPSGRRLLATGNNYHAARTVGIKVTKIRFMSLVASSAMAGFAGIILLAEIGSATDSTATAYLLSALAALFLGTTQVVNRVNVLGTLVAIYLLGIGIKGLQLHGAAPWIQDFFDGLVLLTAVGLASRGRHRGRAVRTAPGSDTQAAIASNEAKPQETEGVSRNA